MVAIKTQNVTRRRLLRGTMGGAAVTVGLPFLNCFLNSNGTALANGQALPVCFGNYSRGLGFPPGFWEPKVAGPGYEMTEHMAALKPMQKKINVLSGMKAFLDGKPLGPHGSGPQVIHGGAPVNSLVGGLASFDNTIADVISKTTRFRSIEMSCDGNAFSISRRSASVVNPAETSPTALYTRLFGPEFVDPNAADFTPDRATMIRKSALSAVAEQRQSFFAGLGAEDRARADEYFTSLRELENQLAISLQKPAPLEACTKPESVDPAIKGSLLITDAQATHKLFAKLVAHALACGQTNVFNLSFDGSLSNLRKAGDSMTYHQYTHEEAVDATLGYQKQVMWFAQQSIAAFGEFLATLDSIKEGDKTLLDRCAVFCSTDHGYARMHGLENIQLMIAGSAGGRLKTGVHVKANGDSVTRAGLTLQQIMGVPISQWGQGANQTAKTITDIVV